MAKKGMERIVVASAYVEQIGFLAFAFIVARFKHACLHSAGTLTRSEPQTVLFAHRFRRSGRQIERQPAGLIAQRWLISAKHTARALAALLVVLVTGTSSKGAPD